MKKKRKYMIIFLLVIFAIISVVLIVLNILDYFLFNQCAWHTGDTTEWDILFDNKDAYDLALNSQNMPVFKNPDKALAELKRDYKQVILEIKNEFNISFDLSKYNYQDYSTYGCQLTTSDPILRHQGRYISQVLDIYENSFICN